MHFQYCPHCGARLTERPMGDDGPTPWCEACRRPWFDMFSTCVIALVHDGCGNVLLLHQEYIHPVYLNLISGYMTPGETAEQTAIREIGEETGLEVDPSSVRVAGTWWFARKEMLMVGIVARTMQGPTPPTRPSEKEVDSTRWVPAGEAPALVHPVGSVSRAMCDLFVGDTRNA